MCAVEHWPHHPQPFDTGHNGKALQADGLRLELCGGTHLTVSQFHLAVSEHVWHLDITSFGRGSPT